MKSYGYARDNEQRGGFGRQRNENNLHLVEDNSGEYKKNFFQRNKKEIIIASAAVATVATAVIVKKKFDKAVEEKTEGMLKTIKKWKTPSQEEEKKENSVDFEEVK